MEAPPFLFLGVLGRSLLIFLALQEFKDKVKVLLTLEKLRISHNVTDPFFKFDVFKG